MLLGILESKANQLSPGGHFKSYYSQLKIENKKNKINSKKITIATPADISPKLPLISGRDQMNDLQPFNEEKNETESEKISRVSSVYNEKEEIAEILHEVMHENEEIFLDLRNPMNNIIAAPDIYSENPTDFSPQHISSPATPVSKFLNIKHTSPSSISPSSPALRSPLPKIVVSPQDRLRRNRQKAFESFEGRITITG